MIRCCFVMLILPRLSNWGGSLCGLRLFFGLKINLGKSEMVLVGEVPNMEDLAVILGCN